MTIEIRKSGDQARSSEDAMMRKLLSDGDKSGES
jgi:hypothetical protein